MRSRRKGWMLWAVLGAGCTDASPSSSDPVVPDAIVDAGPDQRLDAAVDAAPDSHMAPMDMRPPPMPPDPRTCLPPAAQLFADVVSLELDALRIGDRQVPLDDALAPIGVATSPAHDRIVIAREGPATCRIEGRDAAGAPLWQVEVPGRCLPVALDAQQVWAPVQVDGGALWILDIDTGEVERRLALPAPPTTAPGAGGLDESGGSHWYVGAGRQLVRVTPADDWAIASAALDIEARALAVANAEWAVVLGAVDEAPGLGTHAQRIALDALQAQVPLELPGPAYAAPVALPPCDKLEASGGSHWWCGDGMFATAGDRWLGAWTLLDQRPRIEVEIADEMRVTGLAVGRDGLIYSGGSHWIDGGWRVQAHGLDRRETLVEGIEAVCLSAPLLDTDGAFFSHHLQSTVRWQTRSGGHPPGWARAQGNRGNQGHVVGGGCLGGGVDLFTRLHVAPEPIVPIVARILDGDVLIAGVQGEGNGRRTWAGRIAPDGVFRWDLQLPDDPDVDPTIHAPLTIAPRRNFIQLVQSERDFLRTSGITAEGVFTGFSSIGDNPRDLITRAAHSGPPAVVLTGVNVGSPTQQWVLHWVDDVLGGPVFIEHAELFAPQAIATLAPGWVTVGETPDGQAIEASDGEGAIRWRVPLLEMGFELKGVDVEVSGAGEVYALFSESGPAGDATVLVKVDADGALVGQARVPDARPAALGLRPDGAGMILFDDLRVAAVTPAGGVGTLRALPWAGVGVAILPYDDGMFVVGHDEQGGVVLARTSIEGYASCGAAGRCVVPIDCAAEACGLPICVPATGACGLEELVDEMPCGAGQTCGAGMCGP